MYQNNLTNYDNFFGWQWDDLNEEIPPEELRDVDPINKDRVHITFCSRLVKIPSIIGDMTNLTCLRVTHTALTSIPDNLKNLTQLTDVSFGNNRLTEIPEFIKLLVNLKYLYFGGNYVTKIPDNCLGCLTQLRDLYLDENEIEQLPIDIGNLVHLQILSLASNYLSSLTFSVNNMTQLKNLRLSNNRFVSLPDELFYHPTLKQLWVVHNPDLVLPNSQIVELAKKFFVKKLSATHLKWTRTSNQLTRTSFVFKHIDAIRINIATSRLEIRDKIKTRVNLVSEILDNLQKHENFSLPDLVQEEILRLC